MGDWTRFFWQLGVLPCCPDRQRTSLYEVTLTSDRKFFVHVCRRCGGVADLTRWRLHAARIAMALSSDHEVRRG